MKKIFKILIVIGAIFSATYGKAQDTLQTTSTPNYKSIFFTSQFAGSIGFVSLGTGVSNRKQTLHHELLYGFVSEAYGGPLNKVTYKISYYPWSVRVSPRVKWKPFNVTGFAAYHLGKKFTLLHSFKKYDEGYYPWSPALRFHLGASTAVEWKRNSGHDLLFYLETNTNDLYISTLYDNVGYMNFTDIWFLGMGVKLKLGDFK